jgi:serpin B
MNGILLWWDELPRKLARGALVHPCRLLILALGCCNSFSAELQRAETSAVVHGNMAFALDLYGHLKGTPGNLFISPYSISICLALAYGGARGETAAQMSKVLHFPEGEPHSAFGELQRQMTEAVKPMGAQLDLANALWAQQGYSFNPAFMELAQNRYRANVRQANFRTQTEAAASEINKWVSEKTTGKIERVLSQGNLTPSTRLVLVNAIYFKGNWVTRFEKSETQDQYFHLANGSSMMAPLMHHFQDAKYMATESFQAVELPYLGNETSMVILLPRQVNGVGQLEQVLSLQLLTTVFSHLNQQEIELFLPRCTLDSQVDLTAVLGTLGMRDAFGTKADFSGIEGGRALWISGVFHHARVELNEQGTEAAASTAVPQSWGRGAPASTPVVRADHPFLFLIRDLRSGSLLFIGRLSAPGK